MDPIYDDPVFFARYAQMPRSREGLSAAGEWRQLRNLFPPLAGKRVLDLGCGYGWHCRYAAVQGAVRVLGIDASTRMIAEARTRGGESMAAAARTRGGERMTAGARTCSDESMTAEACARADESAAAEVRTKDGETSGAAPVTQKRPIAKTHPQSTEDQTITYRVCGIEEYEYPESAWDCVVSNLVLHYLADLDTVFANVHRTLTPGGTFLFNIEHPVFTAGVGQDWICNDDGTPLYWPVDDYYRPGVRTTHFLDCAVTKQHHTLTQIVQGLLGQGFRLTALEEAEPPAEMMHLPGMADELRRPMMLLVRAEKEVPSNEKDRDR